MKRIGSNRFPKIEFLPSAAALRLAAIHQATTAALAATATTGIEQGVYRFSTLAEMNRHTDEALTRAIVLNARRHVKLG